MVDGMNMLSMLLPGTAVTYQGEELGMESMKMRWDQTLDIQAKQVGPALYEKYSRDPDRTPFQWNSSYHAGKFDDHESTSRKAREDYITE